LKKLPGILNLEISCKGIIVSVLSFYKKQGNMISVIVTTKNESVYLPKLLKSLSLQGYRDFEVIVVDNGSADGTKNIAKKAGARVFDKGPERSSQRNFGVQKAKGEYVLILDADMTLTKGVLRDCAGKVEKNPATSALIIPERSFGIGFWAKCKVFEREFYVGDETIEAPRFFKTSIFKKFGGYDEKITGPEDWDLPLRMRKAGVKIGRIGSFILHNEGKFSPLKSARKKFYYASHARVFLKRHPGQIFVKGNLIFRLIFFKKWKKMAGSPILTIGMFAVKSLEAAVAVLGIIYSFCPKRRKF